MLRIVSQRMIRVKADDIKDFKPSKGEVERLRRLKIDYSDIPPLTDEQLATMVRRRLRRGDPQEAEVLAWLEAAGDYDGWS